MNKIKTLMCLSLCMATALSTMPIVANADDSNVKYGTMDIPYAEFYASEGIGYDVDAVTSATTSKWKNENLVAGTYNEPTLDENGEVIGGTILGVKYYVALTDETLEALGENNYNFTEVEEVPAAYKEVTITEDGVEFSEVKGQTTELDATSTIATSSVWGDYLVQVAPTEEGALDNIGTTYGVIFTTTDGDSYGLRHLENIWRGEFAWGCGVTTVEAGGNTLSHENFVSLSGQTVDTITYITENGYYVVSTEFYVPKKFSTEFSVADVAFDANSTTISDVDFPEDFATVYSIDGLDAQFDGDTITFENALPGLYTLVASDEDGAYADVSTSFLLTSDKLPVTVVDNALVPVDGASDEDLANFLANLSTASINGTEYKLSGHGALSLFNEDGSVNLEVSQGGRGAEAVKIFGEDGKYEVVVNVNGYTTPLEFTVVVGDVPASITDFTVGESTFPRGDINLDGKVNSLDLLMLKKYLLGLMEW